MRAFESITIGEPTYEVLTDKELLAVREHLGSLPDNYAAKALRAKIDVLLEIVDERVAEGEVRHVARLTFAVRKE